MVIAINTIMINDMINLKLLLVLVLLRPSLSVIFLVYQ